MTGRTVECMRGLWKERKCNWASQVCYGSLWRSAEGVGNLECSCLGSKISALSVGKLHPKRGHGRDRKWPSRFVS
jgi:hypothetical protein